ncbi:MAG: hypothetical protein BMS9Abin12_1902 [Acidimicrobiia bacterium]|nr:MAG: hypothetical protein BMS9Abin12_1902 [Acidimicrobiia bacterium]
MKRNLLLVLAIALLAAACSSAADTTSATEPIEKTTTSVVSTTTTAPTTTTTIPPATTTTNATSEADKEAIISAYEIVFSSETTFEEKAALLDDPTGLEETVLKYQETGDSMGGVGAAAKTIKVDGDVAKVTYDLLFGGTPTYPDLTGDAVLVDGTWKITRVMFCQIMTSARVGCPAP